MTAFRATLEDIKTRFDAHASLQRFRPRLAIIKANDRADTAIYIRRKLEALAKVFRSPSRSLVH